MLRLVLDIVLIVYQFIRNIGDLLFFDNTLRACSVVFQCSSREKNTRTHMTTLSLQKVFLFATNNSFPLRQIRMKPYPSAVITWLRSLKREKHEISANSNGHCDSANEDACFYFLHSSFRTRLEHCAINHT